MIIDGALCFYKDQPLSTPPDPLPILEIGKAAGNGQPLKLCILIQTDVVGEGDFFLFTSDNPEVDLSEVTQYTQSKVYEEGQLKAGTRVDMALPAKSGRYAKVGWPNASFTAGTIMAALVTDIQTNDADTAKLALA